MKVSLVLFAPAYSSHRRIYDCAASLTQVADEVILVSEKENIPVGEKIKTVSTQSQDSSAFYLAGLSQVTSEIVLFFQEPICLTPDFLSRIKYEFSHGAHCVWGHFPAQKRNILEDWFCVHAAAQLNARCSYEPLALGFCFVAYNAKALRSLGGFPKTSQEIFSVATVFLLQKQGYAVRQLFGVSGLSRAPALFLDFFCSCFSRYYQFFALCRADRMLDRSHAQMVFQDIIQAVRKEMSHLAVKKVIAVGLVVFFAAFMKAVAFISSQS